MGLQESQKLLQEDSNERCSSQGFASPNMEENSKVSGKKITKSRPPKTKENASYTFYTYFFRRKMNSCLTNP